MPFWWAPILAAGIGATSSFLGGRTSQKSEESMMAQNQATQYDFAQNALRWRVEDAQRAGVHPLYAMGAPLPSFNPVTIGGSAGQGQADAGRIFAQGVMAALDRLGDRVKGQIEPGEYVIPHDALDPETGEVIPGTRVVSAQKANEFYGVQRNRVELDLAEQQRQLSELQLLKMQLDLNKERAAGQGVGAGATEYQPDVITSPRVGESQVTAGKKPFFEEWETRDGPLRLPFSGGQSVGEAVGEVPVWMYPMIVRENVAAYGAEWLNTMWGVFFSGGGAAAPRSPGIPMVPYR